MKRATVDLVVTGDERAAIAAAVDAVRRGQRVLVVLAANRIAFPLFDEAEDGRLLMTRRADPLPGDEARVVLMQNWLAAIRK